MIHERQAQCGTFLFRWRSFLPILFLPFFAVSFASLTYCWGSHKGQHVWAAFCLIASLTGLLVRALTIGFVVEGTSGRGTKTQRATELNTTGMYSICRNPLYLGNLLIWVGILAYTRNPAIVGFFILAFWLYYERIIAAEEAFLVGEFEDLYRVWCRGTPVFLPNPCLWRPPVRKWSTKMILRREYTSILAIGIAFFLMDTAAHFVVEKKLYVDLSWTLFAAGCAAAYVVLRTMKKHTTILDVERPAPD